MEIQTVNIQTAHGNVTITVTDMGQALMVACTTELIHAARIDDLSDVIARALKVAAGE